MASSVSVAGGSSSPGVYAQPVNRSRTGLSAAFSSSSMKSKSEPGSPRPDMVRMVSMTLPSPMLTSTAKSMEKPYAASPNAVR